MIISSLHTANQVICQRFSLRCVDIKRKSSFICQGTENGCKRQFFSLKNIEKGEIFENCYARSDKAINIGNLFLRASLVVYQNSA